MTRGVGVIAEAPWWMDVNGVRVAAGTVRPPDVREMAIGRLRGDGWICTCSDVLELALDATTPCIGIRARVPDERAAPAFAEREHRLERGCGPMHFAHCDTAPGRQPADRAAPALEPFAALFRSLFAAADEASPIGGVHAAALVDAGTIVHSYVDVGRHNAVDKAIGGALLEGRDLRALGLIVSARISGEMAQKAVRCGLAWVASRSLPTQIAVALVERAGMPLIARAAAADATVYGVADAGNGAS